MTPLLYLGSSSVDSYYLCIVSPDSLFVLLIPSYILNDCLFTTVNVKKKKKKNCWCLHSILVFIRHLVLSVHFGGPSFSVCSLFTAPNTHTYG